MDHTGIDAPFSEATHRPNRIVCCPSAIHGCVIQVPAFGGLAPIAALPYRYGPADESNAM